MKAVIISIGDELVLGQTVDSNSAWLSERLSALGIMPLYHKTVGDSIEGSLAAMREACDIAELVVVTGGLGPTPDDLTRQAMALLANRPLDLHPPSLERIKAFFRSLNREMPAMNRIQAMVPRGSDVLDNDWGTAPGIKMKIGKSTIFAFPGVPHEMMKMVDRHILPLFPRAAVLPMVVESLHTFGAGESTVAELLGDMMARGRSTLVGTTVTDGIVTIRVRAECASPSLSRKALSQTIEQVEARLGQLIFGRGNETLPGVVARLAAERGYTVSVAESCTGGLVAKMLTDVPGASTWFRGGWITYSDGMKISELGVSRDLLAREGAVSEAVACAMAEGSRLKSGADLAVALTGIAGPEGGSEGKPVGTVWIAMARKQGGENVHAERFQFPGSRLMIRDRAAKTAINLLRLSLMRKG